MRSPWKASSGGGLPWMSNKAMQRTGLRPAADRPDRWAANVEPERNEVWGIEFDWFAVDSRGQVGFFASAGSE